MKREEREVQSDADFEKRNRKSRFEFTKLTTLVFVFVSVRGPLFRVEDVTELGWNRIYVWRALKSLVSAGVLEKFDRKSYGLSEEARGVFRAAFGGGANDAAFAYSTMGVESWSKLRLKSFKEKLGEIWEQRPQRIKDGSRIESSTGELQKLLFEKIEEASQIVLMLQRENNAVLHESPK